MVVGEGDLGDGDVRMKHEALTLKRAPTSGRVENSRSSWVKDDRDSSTSLSTNIPNDRTLDEKL